MLPRRIIQLQHKVNYDLAERKQRLVSSNRNDIIAYRFLESLPSYKKSIKNLLRTKHTYPEINKNRKTRSDGYSSITSKISVVEVVINKYKERVDSFYKIILKGEK